LLGTRRSIDYWGGERGECASLKKEGRSLSDRRGSSPQALWSGEKGGKKQLFAASERSQTDPEEPREKTYRHDSPSVWEAPVQQKKMRRRGEGENPFRREVSFPAPRKDEQETLLLALRKKVERGQARPGHFLLRAKKDGKKA